MGAREVFEGLRRHMSGEDVDGLWAEDVVVETPFAPPGRPRRVEGRDRFLEIARAGRAALPFRLETGEVTVHDTADPDLIIVEYDLGATLPGTGERVSAPFIGVLRVRDGQIVLWREYQDVLAVAAATGRLPDLVAGLSTA
ncbi:nuclear transport factor 2 family protein [Nonomuraea sp. K274]|uniref:Nuclear transport factor 2 family protein n=1 Tax=Nonomuraea cypriaca TaxID=1187855 RepID=A0A931F4A2_9ACTN|nr:nuclear transport factor 2 family protein [Nonomuraea cypriaca]MBF8192457.1 nuclear transport factor 2 family protein [Nonomuraea cypriaca]